MNPTLRTFARKGALPFVVLLVVALIVWKRMASPVQVEAGRVVRGTVVEEAFGRGTVESEREAAVGFDLVGRLSEVLVEEGARVTLGQELARLETDQARADLRSAQTGVASARSTLLRLSAEEERARSLLATAQREVARAQQLFDSGALPGQQRDDANDRVRIAHAELDRVLAQRSEATRGIDVAAGGAEQRRVTMVRATLLAPFEGLVTRRLREPGDTVTVGSTVLRIVDTTRVVVNASLDETLLPRLKEEQKGMILFPGSETMVEGRVSKVSWEADRQTHEILAEVTPNKLERRVAIGQRADVRIEVARREGVLTLPSVMMQRDELGPFVYVDRAGKIAIARPKLGLSGRDQVEIVEGLSEGDSVLRAKAAGASLPLGRRWSP